MAADQAHPATPPHGSDAAQRPPRARWRSLLRLLALLFVTTGIALFVLDRLFPPALTRADRGFSSVVLAADGTPLRSFADQAGIWRSPTSSERVSPLFLEALIHYEDRWFHQHPGVNPLALIRASWQAAANGEVVSGGSTLTMQVVRLLEPRERTLPNKLIEILRALQLELRLSKREILDLYLNNAPYGGTIEGVETAAQLYLGKSAANLSHAEAALLAVLPQAPSRFRPDRHPQRAQAARDKVLRRLLRDNIWDKDDIEQAFREQVAVFAPQRPLLSPLLARRLRPESGAVQTGIDANLQALIEDQLRQRLPQLAQRSSMAVLVTRNEDMLTLAYVGSADFLDSGRFGHVDMVQAQRSYGSLLKPFVYGLAIERGLVHSESLLSDVPMDIGGYRPKNFSGRFRGPVSVSEALQKSLNVPAVDLADRIGIADSVDRLRHGGLQLSLPTGTRPNLSLVLGGAASSLESLVGIYRALASGGLSSRPRMRPDEPFEQRRLLAPGAAWIVREILAGNAPSQDWIDTVPKGLAWKTGTSYGHRDAWAIGVTEAHTIGVWVGRPDGTPSPGQYGLVTAVPILMDVARTLEQQRALPGSVEPRPESVSEATICWPTGQHATNLSREACHEKRTALLLDDTVPPTLPDRGDVISHGLLDSYRVAKSSGQRLSRLCHPAGEQIETRSRARWPAALSKWLSQRRRDAAQLPPLDPRCPAEAMSEEPRPGATIQIRGIDDGAVLYRPSDPNQAHQPITFSVRADGGGMEQTWIINDRWVAESARGETVQLSLDQAGNAELSVIDGVGGYDTIELEIR